MNRNCIIELANLIEYYSINLKEFDETFIRSVIEIICHFNNDIKSEISEKLYFETTNKTFYNDYQLLQIANYDMQSGDLTFFIDDMYNYFANNLEEHIMPRTMEFYFYLNIFAVIIIMRELFKAEERSIMKSEGQEQIKNIFTSARIKKGDFIEEEIDRLSKHYSPGYIYHIQSQLKENYMRHPFINPQNYSANYFSLYNASRCINEINCRDYIKNVRNMIEGLLNNLLSEYYRYDKKGKIHTTPIDIFNDNINEVTRKLEEIQESLHQIFPELINPIIHIDGLSEQDAKLFGTKYNKK